MATSLLLACGLIDHKLSQFIFVREDVDIDGSFLISCVLAQRLKLPNSGIILTCFHHTYQHYCNAGMKLGSNLNSSKNNGSLKVIEPFNNKSLNFNIDKGNNTNNINNNNNNIANDKIINNGNDNENVDKTTMTTDPQQTKNNNQEFEDIFNSNLLLYTDEMIMNKLWHLIVEVYAAEYLKTKATTILIIDDISFLINLGINENLLMRFCSRLHILLQSYQNLYIIIKLNASTIYEQLCNNLEDLADLEIRIERMKSGNFMDIDGKLEIYKRQSDGSATKTRKEVLYKVNERNIRIFAPGELGVKI